MNPVSPTRVIGGRYVVLAELGRGGMGVVWRAEDRVMGRQVAVKELHLPGGLSAAERASFRERLLREARTAGRINHPGIVTVYDVLTDDGVDHIVMQLIEARSLADVVGQNGPLDERAATSLAQQLLAALGTAHERGIVHRDVKPSNVMLGAGGHVTLTDFGIAQAADDPRLTTTGSLIGSPAFIAPERLEGGDATPGTDLWALGVTLYHAVQGTSPFDRDTTAATISAVLHAEIPPCRARGPLGSVIAGLLQRDPRARLSGAQAAGLLSATGTVPIRDQPARTLVGSDPSTSPIPPVPARRRWWLLPAIALLVGLAGGVAAGLWMGSLGRAEVATFTYGVGGDVPVDDGLSVSPGACVIGQLAAGRQFGSTSSCDNAHDIEVFETFAPFDTQEKIAYPGAAELKAYATGACRLVFDSDRIVADGKSGLAVAVLVPSETEFGRESETSTGYYPDREVVCALYAKDGSQLTGSRIAEGG